jgi:hypothetical protein
MSSLTCLDLGMLQQNPLILSLTCLDLGMLQQNPLDVEPALPTTAATSSPTPEQLPAKIRIVQTRQINFLNQSLE